ncbi:PH domain-containing protein [Stenotrophomonas sp. MMGLT7]|uniref:PH domain-containing protein n=1 Tax=Stenotrophomonas sp. MMGLT7 TaxID=2901227 RepID=UPI001E3C2ED0|nr:PH domain-containing protein [Stenotrophomonas sp. MMGLT7]MCD7100353.1 PH domain-containing protein [Stenotrophomonas sp. MMGLT7]
MQPLAWAVLLGVMLVVATGLVVPLHRSGSASNWLVPLLVAAALLAALSLALRRRRIAIDGTRLRVASTFYTRRIAVRELDLDRARIVDLAEHDEFAPRLKINGYGLPGLRSGHYRLRNGVRAFCLLTDSERVLVLPQRDGRCLLLSPEKPQALLARLRELAVADRRG